MSVRRGILLLLAVTLLQSGCCGPCLAPCIPGVWPRPMAAEQPATQRSVGGDRVKPAPDADVVATLKGEAIHRKDVADGNALLGRVLGTLLEDFATERKVDATEAEITEQIRRLDEMERTEESRHRRQLEKLRAALAEAQNDYQRQTIAGNIKSLEETHAALQKMKPMREKYRLPEKERREMSRDVIRRYKINQAVWAEYGGRIIFQQFGPEPLDAYRKLLEEHQKKGTFKIVDPSMAEPFWSYIRDEKMHTFLDGPEAAKLMTTPWWAGPPPED